jgi:predicted secreted protein
MATHGHGTTLSGATTGAIAQIISVGLPDQKVDDLDVTTMASANKWREFIPGLKDAGTIQLQLLYEKANYQKVQNILGATPEVWTITLPDGSTFVSTAYINANGGDSPMEDKVTQSVTMKLSGEPTFTPAA